MEKYQPQDVFNKVSKIADRMRWHEINGPVSSEVILKFARQVQRVLIHEDMQAILERARHHKDFQFTAPDSYQLRSNGTRDRAGNQQRYARHILRSEEITRALSPNDGTPRGRSRKNRRR